MTDSGQVESALAAELRRLPAETRELLALHGFEPERFVALARRLLAGSPGDANRVRARVDPLQPGDVQDLPDSGSADYAALEQRGLRELGRGRVALVVLAGGMATRMGGVVKALVPALPGHTFLDLRLREQRAVEQRSGVQPPLWLMTSHATDSAIRDALAHHPHGGNARTFVQNLAPRLTPKARLYRDRSGAVSLYATGHGDLVDALLRSGLLADFVEQGGHTLFVTNLDNLGATLDPAILGWHLAHGTPLTSEVVERRDSDRGGVPVRMDGAIAVLEELRWPPGFDAASAAVFNINSFWLDAARLLAPLPPSTYFAVHKQLGADDVVQLERLLNELVEWLPARLLQVPRSGPNARFLPVKDVLELEQRQSEIERVARARGLLD